MMLTWRDFINPGMLMAWLEVAIGMFSMSRLDYPSVKGHMATGFAVGAVMFWILSVFQAEIAAADAKRRENESKVLKPFEPKPQLMEQYMTTTGALQWTIINLPAGVVQKIAAAVIRDGATFAMRNIPVSRAEFVQAREVFLARGYLALVGKGHRFNREGRLFLLKVYTGQVKPVAASPSASQGQAALRLVTRAQATHGAAAHGGEVV